MADYDLVFFDGREVLGGFEHVEGLWGFTAVHGAMLGVTWSTF